MNRLAAIPVILAALLLAACGTNQQPVASGSSAAHHAPKATPTPNVEQITVGTPYFAGDTPQPQYSYNGNPTGGVTVTNESKTMAAESVVMQWTATNAAGAVIDTEPTTLGIIQPSQTLYVTTLFSAVNTTDIAAIKVIALPNLWVKATDPTATISGTNVSITPATYNQNTFTVAAELDSGWTQNLESTPSWAYCTNAAGQFVGGDSTLVNLLPAKGTGTGSASYTIYTTGTPANCTVDAQPALLPQGT